MTVLHYIFGFAIISNKRVRHVDEMIQKLRNILGNNNFKKY